MKSKNSSYNKMIILFCSLLLLAIISGCNGGTLPDILIFSVNPSIINPGESSTLTWTVSNADTIMITPDIGSVSLDGTVSVSPGETTTYTLIATGGGETVTATVTITAQVLPVYNLTKGTYYNTIQEALDDANNNNSIEVADGTYDETIHFPSDKRIILQSINGPSLTVIRGEDNSYTLNLDSSLSGTTIEGFIITHAVGLSGGGIYNEIDSNLTIDNCTISENTATGSGGGIYNEGTLTISNTSNIISNTCNTWGGGIYNSGTLTISDASTVSENTATGSGGGGIFNSGTLTITGESTISSNESDYGGGIDNWGILTISDASTIFSNVAKYGGGIYTLGSLINITTSNIWDNSAASAGGGIYIETGTPTIGGISNDQKNNICGNYLNGISPSLDQQIRGASGNLYDIYKNTNYIRTYCIIPI